MEAGLVVAYLSHNITHSSTDEEPPEYNVKGRLEQLNAELANDPAPVEGERETRVGFKAEIVDLVAPPQDFSDDDASQPNSARDDSQQGANPKPSPFAATSPSESSTAESKSSPSSPPKSSPFAASDRSSTESEDGRGKKEEAKNDDEAQEKKKLADDPNKKQFVVERDGQFSVLSANELTPSERAMLMEEGAGDASKKQAHQTESQRSNDGRASGDDKSGSAVVVPRPPNQPRPNTAAASTGGGRRSFVRQGGQPSPRPKSADHHQQQQQGKRNTTSSQSSHSSGLSDDFNYRSPYARSEELREMSREHSRRQEEERKEKEKRRKEEEEQRRAYNDSAFLAWLRRKREANQKNAEEDKGDKKRSEDERVSLIF